MRFGFLLKRGKPEASELASELIAMLRVRGHESVVSDLDGSAPVGATVIDEPTLAASVDVLVVLGGDGTFLYGAGLVGGRGVPLFGVNLGSLGFITHFQRADALSRLQAVCAGEIPVDERVRLRVVVRAAATGQVVETRAAVNDAVISQPAMARLLDLQASLDDRLITTYKADGLILATPTGSTAYNLAAGGPILTPDLEAFVLTPICPHTLTNRPLVVPAKGRLVVRNISEGPAQLTVDGQWGRPLGSGDEVEASRDPAPLRLFRGSGSFFSILNQKLAWGVRRA